MKVTKFLVTLSVTTMCALGYVHTQVELVKISYAIDCKERAKRELLDRKESLGYNIENLESPSRLENALWAQNIDIAYPKRAQLVELKSGAYKAKKIRTAKAARTTKINRVAEWAGWRTEAHAKD